VSELQLFFIDSLPLILYTSIIFNTR